MVKNFKTPTVKKKLSSVLFILTANDHILTESWLQIVEVTITSVGMSVQDIVLTLFIILPSNNECEAYLTLPPFTVVSAYIIVNKSFCCVTGFDIILVFATKTLHSCDLSTSRSHANICRLDCRIINSLTHSHLVVLILFL